MAAIPGLFKSLGIVISKSGFFQALAEKGRFDNLDIGTL